MSGPLNDHLTLDDRLGRIPLLHQVYRHVRDAETPCVIGIHGDWGSGKSSFLRQLEGLLTNFSQAEGREVEPPEKEKPLRDRLWDGKGPGPTYPVVWFEAWRYQHDPQPILSLLREIRKQLSPAQKAWAWGQKEATVAIETALAGIDGISKFIGFKVDPDAIRKRGERIEQERQEVPSFTVSVTELLDHALKQVVDEFEKRNQNLTYEKRGRVVVLIDDLDRCDAEVAQKLLEGLKVFLGLKHVVFVIAMDELVVEEFIAAKYNKDRHAGGADAFAGRRARQYLEKLCQCIYRLPFAIEPENLLLQLLVKRRASFENASSHHDTRGDLIDMFFATDPKILHDNLRNLLIHAEVSDLSDDNATIDLVNAIGQENFLLWRLLWRFEAVPPNPRKIKLLAEVLSRMLRKMPEGDYSDQSLKLAYVLSYAYQFEPELYRLIETYRESLFTEWLLPLISSSSQGIKPEYDEILRAPLVLPSTGPARFIDPVRAGLFYPATILATMQGVAADDLAPFFY